MPKTFELLNDAISKLSASLESGNPIIIEHQAQEVIKAWLKVRPRDFK